jgi:hypothetical protein
MGVTLNRRCYLLFLALAVVAALAGFPLLASSLLQDPKAQKTSNRRW